MSEEAMREEVAQAVEVAANKAAEEEISKLAEFESAIDERSPPDIWTIRSPSPTQTAWRKCCQCSIPSRSHTWWKAWKP